MGWFVAGLFAFLWIVEVLFSRRLRKEISYLNTRLVHRDRAIDFLQGITIKQKVQSKDFN